MPIIPFSWRAFSSGIWIAGPRENNPPGTVRRANATFPLRTGSLRSRSGMTTIASGLTAHSLFKAFGRRIAGVGALIYREVASVFTQLVTGVPALNGNTLTFLSTSSNPLVDDSVFVAGGGNLFKINVALDTASKWGIAPLAVGTTPPGAALATRSSKDINTMDSLAGWSATDVADDGTESSNGTLALDNAKRVQGTGSIRVRVLKDTHTQLDLAPGALIGGSPLDLSKFGAPGDSGDEDYIEIFLAVARPKHMKNMEITFFVGANPEDERDTYTREFTFKVVNQKNKTKLIGTGDLIRRKDIQALLREDSSRVTTRDFSQSELMPNDQIAVTRKTWTRLTIPKSSFDAKGNAGTPGKTFANVQGLRVSFETNKNGKSRVWIDRIRMIGGVGMQGDYNYMFTFAAYVPASNTLITRSNPFPTVLDTTANANVFNPTRINDVERQGVLLGSTAGGPNLPAPTDAQVTHLEVWRTVGNGVDLFLVDKVASTVGAPATGYTDTVADVPGLFSGGGGTRFLQPVELPDDNDRPLDTLVDVVGPVYGRLFGINRLDNRIWYTPPGRFEAFPNFTSLGNAPAQDPNATIADQIVSPVTANETPQKLIVFNEQLFALSNRAFYRCLTTDEPFIFIPVAGAPGTRFPKTVVETDGGVAYQGLDGMRLFDGMTSKLDDNLAPVFRGGSSDGITGPFQGQAAVFARGEYLISDDANTTLAFHPETGCRQIGIKAKAFFWEKDSRVLLASAFVGGAYRIVSFEGDANGEVAGLVGETTLDNGAALDTTWEVETGTAGTQVLGSTGLGGVPSPIYKGAGVWGLAQRIYIEGQFEGQNVTVALVLDNNVIVSLGTVTLPVGVKQVVECAVHRWGYIYGVRLAAAGLTKRIEVSAIEMDVYVPDRSQ